jgi:hypothetical protein
MTPILSAAGALAAGLPLVIVDTNALGGGIIWTGSIIASLMAIGLGVGKVWQLARAAYDRLNQLDEMAKQLEHIINRLDKANL